MGFWKNLREQEQREATNQYYREQAERKRKEDDRQAENQKSATGSYWPYDPPGESGMH